MHLTSDLISPVCVPQLFVYSSGQLLVMPDFGRRNSAGSHDAGERGVGFRVLPS